MKQDSGCESFNFAPVVGKSEKPSVLRRPGDVLSLYLHSSFMDERVEETSFIFVGLRFPSLYYIELMVSFTK